MVLDSFTDESWEFTISTKIVQRVLNKVGTKSAERDDEMDDEMDDDEIEELKRELDQLDATGELEEMDQTLDDIHRMDEVADLEEQAGIEGVIDRPARRIPRPKVAEVETFESLIDRDSTPTRRKRPFKERLFDTWRGDQ